MPPREQILTKGGYDFFEVSSSLQKSIRRCDEDSALYWACELIYSNYDNYLWKRILIMVSEDVGLAEPDLAVRIQALKQNYDFLKKNKSMEKTLPLVHAVLLLVRAKKSRIVDWCKGKMFGEYHFIEKEIPDYALDKHTIRGKMMGRTIEHFFDEGAKLNNHEVCDREEEYLQWCRDHWTDKKWCKEEERRKLEFKNRGRNQNELF